MCMWVTVCVCMWMCIKYLSENKENLLKTEHPIKLLLWYFIHSIIIFVWSNWFSDVSSSFFLKQKTRTFILLYNVEHYFSTHIVFDHLPWSSHNKILLDHKSINDKKNMLHQGRKSRAKKIIWTFACLGWIGERRRWKKHTHNVRIR